MRHPHRNTAGAQLLDVEGAILLVIGDDEIGTQLGDRGTIRVLRAPHPAHRMTDHVVHVGWAHTVVGATHQKLWAGGDDGLGE